MKRIGYRDTVAIGRPDGVERAGPERPALARGQVLDRAGARDDVVGLPVILVPERDLGARLEADVVEREPEAVGRGKQPRAACVAGRV